MIVRSNKEVIITKALHTIKEWFSPPTINGVVVMVISSNIELSPESIVRELDRTKL